METIAMVLNWRRGSTFSFVSHITVHSLGYISSAGLLMSLIRYQPLYCTFSVSGRRRQGETQKFPTKTLVFYNLWCIEPWLDVNGKKRCCNSSQQEQVDGDSAKNYSHFWLQENTVNPFSSSLFLSAVSGSFLSALLRHFCCTFSLCLLACSVSERKNMAIDKILTKSKCFKL